jgi:nucleoside 2-deoxyribosyltransferase
MKSVYLAGPINGKSYEEARNGWRLSLSTLLSPGIQPLSPMRQEGHLQEVTELTGMPYDDHFWSKQRAIVTKDLVDVRRCDVVVVNLCDTKKVSIGTMVEMGWAQVLNKPIVLVIEDDAEQVNPHHHLFVYELAHFRVNNIKDAATIVNGLLSTGV